MQNRKVSSRGRSVELPTVPQICTSASFRADGEREREGGGGDSKADCSVHGAGKHRRRTGARTGKQETSAQSDQGIV